jgi:hypothetical protein
MAAAETFHIRALSATAIFQQKETEATETGIYLMVYSALFPPFPPVQVCFVPMKCLCVLASLR